MPNGVAFNIACGASRSLQFNNGVSVNSPSFVRTTPSPVWQMSSPVRGAQQPLNMAAVHMAQQVTALQQLALNVNLGNQVLSLPFFVNLPYEDDLHPPGRVDVNRGYLNLSIPHHGSVLQMNASGQPDFRGFDPNAASNDDSEFRAFIIGMAASNATAALQAHLGIAPATGPAYASPTVTNAMNQNASLSMAPAGFRQFMGLYGE